MGNKSGLPTQNLHEPKGIKVALGPNGLAHTGPSWAAHREPVVSPKLWASSGHARTGSV